MRRIWFVSFMFYFLISGHFVMSQDVSVKLGPDEIGVNQAFTITITVQNESIKKISDFPNIKGFSKRNISSSSTTNYVNGRMSSSQSRTMNYIPQKEGRFTVPPFTITVNGKSVRSPGKAVKVGPPVKKQRRGFFDQDPFEDFFGRPKRTTEFVDVEADAFLALTTDKDEVYQGEGFTTTLAFYVSARNRADMRFYELGKQITEITNKVKPSNCWEESFNIDNITGEQVTINNQRYTQYKVYQATFYPWNTEAINFPSVDLELIKYKVAKNPSFFGRNKQEDFQNFSSRPKTIKVKELPPHPMKEIVAVGKYRLKEVIDKPELETGESFNYSFNISGIGNINAIEDPLVPKDQDLINIYDPNKRININRSGNTVSGTKSFNYYGIPNEPGSYNLKDFFSWIYFDPVKEVYDTLTANTSIVVTGESKKNESISATDLGTFYDKIEFEQNQLTANNGSLNSKLVLNIVLIAVLLTVAGVLGKYGYDQRKLMVQEKEEIPTISLQKAKEPKPIVPQGEMDSRSLVEKLGENSLVNALGWGIILILVTMIVEFVAVKAEMEQLINGYSIFFCVLIPVLFYLFSRNIFNKKQAVSLINMTASFIFLMLPFFIYLFVFDGIALGSTTFDAEDIYFGVTTKDFVELISSFVIVVVALIAAAITNHIWNNKTATSA